MAFKPRGAGTILVVEDDPVMRKAIERAVAGTAKVVFAHNGKAAIAALTDQPKPRFVLLDYMLPDTDGLQVLMRVRAEPRTKALPVVMFSSISDPQRVRAALAEGANSWVTKTDDPIAFEAAVQAICRYWLDLNTHA